MSREFVGRMLWASKATRTAVLAGMVVTFVAAAMLTGAGVAQAGTARHVAPRRDPAAATRPVRARALKRPAAPATGKRVPWPSHGSYALTLTPKTVVRPQGSAVSLQATGATVSPVQLQVLPQGAGHADGVDGLIATVSMPSSKATAAMVTMDLTGVSDSFGGDWGSRAYLEQLTGCTVAAGKVTGCTGRRPLTTRRTASGSISAAVSIPGTTAAEAAPATAGSTKTAAAQAKAAAPLVVAATAAANGTAGDYTATPLAASSTWSAGGQTGDFNWSYPLTGPPAPGDLTPDLAVTYDSASVDGRVASSNNQPSALGDGFDLSGGGYIQRSFIGCADDMTGSNTTTKTGDLCWKSNNATIDLGGRSGPLVLKSSADNTWRMYSDDGSQLVRHGTLGGPGEYWTLTTTDGTVYTFGKGTPAVGTTATNSAWSVPVFGNQTGEPCHATTFAASACQAVWRWNLDSVVDVHGNAIDYFYQAETNQYGENLNHTVATYTRGGILTSVEYGLNTHYASTVAATAKYVFSNAQRCLPSGSITCTAAQLTSANASYWPDVPFDQLCTAASGTVSAPATGGCVKVQSPAFFSRLRITGVNSQVWTSGTTWRDVDRYVFTQTFLDPGDTTSKILWLSSIAHTGVSSTNTTLAAPTVTLQPMSAATPNRVDAAGDNAPPINRYRLSWINNGTGGQISVGYYPQDCTATNKPSTPIGNTRDCFPVYYTKPGDTTPTLNWFNKYLVSRVDASDSVGGQVDQVTDYRYVGGAAWHFDRDDTTPQKYRTWGQFRGFTTVQTFTGGPTGPWTADETRYLRGMDGDCANTACTSTTPASVTDSRGGTITDEDLDNGFVRETRSFNGATLTFDSLGNITGTPTIGSTVSEQLNTPVFTAATATDSTRTAKIRNTGTVNARQFGADGVTYRETQTSTTYNSNGMATQSEDLGDDSASVTADDECTRTTYANDTTHWILDSPVSSETVDKNCSATVTYPDDVLSSNRTLYDGATTWSGTPTLTYGDVTGTLTGTWDSTISEMTFPLTGSAAYDSLGRQTDAKNGLAKDTSTAYTPAGEGPLTTMAITNPRLQTATTTYDPGRGVVLTVKDVANKVTTSGYDALGRLTGVWLPGRATTASANSTFTYALGTATTPTVVSTGVLRNNGSYTTSDTYYDGQLQPVQTQAPAADGTAARVITSTVYDGRGLTVSTLGPVKADGAVGSGLVTVPDSTLPTRTDVTYDGAGRPTVSAQRVGVGSAAWHTLTSTTGYDGPTTTVTPPQGGTIATTTADVRGNTTALRQYTTSSGLSGASQVSSYTYRPDRKPLTMTDPAGHTWTRAYDTRGRLVSSTDPDAGTTTTTYNNDDSIATSTDGRGVQLGYTYDDLGRKTEQDRVNGSTTTKLASWTYDTLVAGQLTSSSSFYNGLEYKRSVTSYDALDHVTGTDLSIPTGETGLSGDYTTIAKYNLDGQISNYLQPTAGGLTAEAQNYGYNALGLPGSLVGAVNGSTYSAYGEPTQIAADNQNINQIYYDYTYADGTRRLLNRTVDRGTGNGDVDSTNYTYDDAGNLTSSADKPTDAAAGYTNDTQCFTYDALRDLTSAWTPASGDCTAAQSTSLLGGPAPYWQDWQIDLKTGNRQSQTSHAASGNTVASYGYTPVAGSGPHAVTSLTTTPPTGPATTTNYQYDNSGATLSVTPTTGTGSTYTWDEQGRLSGATTSSGSTSQIYDADGNLLISRDASGSTLFADSTTEIRSSTAGTISVQHTYTWLGQTVATRTTSATGTTGTTTSFIVGDQHGTGELAINATTLAVTSQSFTDPYGNTRGTTTGAWPDDRSFVGGIANPTSVLTQLGARPYDPATGKFLTVDPLLDPSHPQQWNPYTYADNNPTTLSDPTGTKPLGASDCVFHCGEDGSSASSSSSSGNTGNGHHTTDVAVTPRVHVDGDPARAAALGKAFQATLRHFNTKLNGSEQQEMLLWYYTCFGSGYGPNRGLCGGQLLNTLRAATTPWDPSNQTHTQLATGGIIFIGKNLGEDDEGVTQTTEVIRSLSDPDSMVGVTYDQIQAMIPEGWTAKDLGKGVGTRWLSPGKNPGGKGYIEFQWKGSPSGDAFHDDGPHTKIMIGGVQYRTLAAGNTAVGDPSVPNTRVDQLGNSGIYDLTPKFIFGGDDGGGGGE